MKQKMSFKLLNEMVHDIKRGVSGESLIEKYELSGEEFRNVLKVITDLKKTTPAGLYGREERERPDPAVEAVRMLPRTKVFVQLPIHDAEHGRARGVVADITERGVAVKGIDAAVNQTRRFVVEADEIFRLDPFMFDAKCRWVKQEGPQGDLVGGFEITYISAEDLDKLRKLVLTILCTLEGTDESVETTEAHHER
ncbi:MAG: hypothetical protein V2B18_00140 [Pseudomonadota bacterium]